jgi:hypothetical protein
VSRFTKTPPVSKKKPRTGAGQVEWEERKRREKSMDGVRTTVTHVTRDAAGTGKMGQRVRSIGEGAKFTVHENNDRGPPLGRWKPFEAVRDTRPPEKRILEPTAHRKQASWRISDMKPRRGVWGVWCPK